VVHLAPNPYAAVLDRHSFVVGTDGTNVQDLVRQLGGPNSKTPRGGADGSHDDVDAPGAAGGATELEALRLVLSWSHLCPNGPDSVPTVPHAELDPMVLDRIPDLLFCGNADRFATSAVGSCRLVCIPRFSATGQAVLVRLRPNGQPPSVELLRFEAEEERQD
jgi:DNA polymerase II small subunit/DNA polymerase delta subunit B